MLGNQETFTKAELKQAKALEEKIRMRKEALAYSISRNRHQDENQGGKYDISNVIAEAEKYYEWLIAKL